MREFGYDDRDPIEEEIDKDFFTRLFYVMLHSDSVEMRHMANGDNVVLIHVFRKTLRGVDQSLNTALTIAYNKLRIDNGE